MSIWPSLTKTEKIAALQVLFARDLTYREIAAILGTTSGAVAGFIFTHPAAKWPAFLPFGDGITSARISVRLKVMKALPATVAKLLASDAQPTTTADIQPTGHRRPAEEAFTPPASPPARKAPAAPLIPPRRPEPRPPATVVSLPMVDERPMVAAPSRAILEAQSLAGRILSDFAELMLGHPDGPTVRELSDLYGATEAQVREAVARLRDDRIATLAKRPSTGRLHMLRYGERP